MSPTEHVVTINSNNLDLGFRATVAVVSCTRPVKSNWSLLFRKTEDIRTNINLWRHHLVFAI